MTTSGFTSDDARPSLGVTMDYDVSVAGTTVHMALNADEWAAYQRLASVLAEAEGPELRLEPSPANAPA